MRSGPCVRGCGRVVPLTAGISPEGLFFGECLACALKTDLAEARAKRRK